MPYMLVECCEKYPDCRSLSARCMELYGAWLSDHIDFGGQKRYTSISITLPDDRFALEGECLEREGCGLLAECVLRPLAKDGAFDAELTRHMKCELIDAIDSVVNDKRNLAAQHGARIAFKGEPAGEPIQGSHEEAERVTPESAWVAYRRMLEQGHIEIFAVGQSDFADSEQVFSEAFSGISRHDICELNTKPSMLKPETEYCVERFPMQQAITRMYFKQPAMSDRYANVLLSTILGGMTTSRFFENIREKQSLCYYCSCFSNRFNKVLTVYAGVEPQNAERTRAAVLAEIKSICDSGVSEDELERAKLEVINEAMTTYDGVSSIAGWYLGQVHDGEFISPEEYIERIREVTAERVRAVCLGYSLDTVYTLSGGEDVQ